MKKEEIIQKWLAGELSEAELKAFEADERFANERKIIATAARFKAPEPETSFEELRDRLYPEQDSGVRKLEPWRSFMKIAAVLIAGLALFFIFFNKQELEINTSVAEKTNVTLPDASKVILNAASSLSYDSKTWGDERKVSLEGEAYFKVAKGARFDVVTSQGTVSVLGTQFTVKQRADFFEVICYEGLVQVVSSTRIEKLPPGKTFRSISGNISLGESKQQKPSWIKNQTRFDRIPFAEVLAELERQYDISIETQEINTQRIFTGNFVHNDLEAALKAISVPLGLSFKIDGKKVRLFTRAE